MKKTLNSLFIICLSLAVFYPLDHLLSLITSADTYNERHVEFQLNDGALSPEAALIIASIEPLSLAEQRRALNDLSGQQYANLVQSNQAASQQFMRRMYESVRYDSLGLHCGSNCDQFQVWSAVGGGQVYQRRSHGTRGFRMDDVNVAFGVQKPLNICFLDSWLTLGAAGSYESDDLRFNHGGHGKGNDWQGAIYYMWNNCRYYSFSATILGDDCIKIRRPFHFDRIDGRARHQTRSRARITQWTSYSEFGFNCHYHCFYIQPFVGIEYAFYRRHALSEHHAHPFNLHIRGKNVSATIGRLGVHLTTALPCWDLFLSGDLAWRSRFNFLQERFQAHFKNFGSQFRIKGPHQKPNGVEGALNLAKCFCDCWEAYVELAGERWERYSAWNLSGGLSVSW